MKLPLFIDKSEYDLIQNYLRLNIESIKFDNKNLVMKILKLTSL